MGSQEGPIGNPIRLLAFPPDQKMKTTNASGDQRRGKLSTSESASRKHAWSLAARHLLELAAQRGHMPDHVGVRERFGEEVRRIIAPIDLVQGNSA